MGQRQPLRHAWSQSGTPTTGAGRSAFPPGACGLVGLKPTNSRVSLGPEFGDILGGLVVEHVVARSVRDSAAVLDAISRPMPGDPAPMDWGPGRFAEAASRFPEAPLRIGLLDSHSQTTVHADCVEAVQNAAETLQELGHQVELSHPAAISDPAFFRHFGRQMCSGVAWVLDHYWPRRTGVRDRGERRGAVDLGDGRDRQGDERRRLSSPGARRCNCSDETSKHGSTTAATSCC